MTEEVFHNRIVPTVSPPGHGWGDGIVLGEEMVGRRSVLVALVTMEEQAIGNLLFLLGLLEGVEYQTNRVFGTHFMCHDKAIEQILDGGEICPALLSRNIRNIGHPFLVGTTSSEFTIEQIVITMIRFQ